MKYTINLSVKPRIPINDESSLRFKMKHAICTIAIVIVFLSLFSCGVIKGKGEAQNIAESLEAQGHKIDKRKIVLDEPIKSLGIYSVPIKLHPEVEAKVKVWVVKE